jgi:hypothetical protein
LKSLRVIIDDDFREFYPEYLVAKKKKKKKIEIVEEKKKSTSSNATTNGSVGGSGAVVNSDEVKSEEKKKKKKKKDKKQKIETNGEISWKSVEDSTILNTLDHYGKNWSLVSEKVSHSMYPTTSPRNPKNCENRFDVIKNQTKTDLQNEISTHKQKNLNEISKIWEIKTVKEIKPKVVNESFDRNRITVSTPIDYLLKLVNVQKIDEKLPPRLMTMQSSSTTPMNNPVQNVLMVNPTSGNTSPRMQPNSLQIQLPNQKLSPSLNQNPKLSPSLQKYSPSFVPSTNPKISPNSLITNPQQMMEHQNIQIGKKTEQSTSSKPIAISRQIQKNVSPQVSPQLNQQPQQLQTQQPMTQNFVFLPSNKSKRESDNVNNSQKKKRLKKE